MQKISQMIALSSALLVGSPAFASQLILDYIQFDKTTEASGDELYFNVTAYYDDRSTDHYQIPTAPTHWLSDHLSEVQNVVLWEHDWEGIKGAELVVALTERDAPPWNIDDLIGTVKLKISHQGDRLQTQWNLLAEQGVTREVEGNPLVREYLMTGDEGRYQIGLHFEE